MTRYVYKESVDSKRFIKVGELIKGNLVFSSYSKKEVEHPSSYYSDYYIDKEITQDLFSHIDYSLVSTAVIEIKKVPFTPKNRPNQIIKSVDGHYIADYVTGYITEDGEVVYYDQYL